MQMTRQRFDLVYKEVSASVNVQTVVSEEMVKRSDSSSRSDQGFLCACWSVEAIS